MSLGWRVLVTVPAIEAEYATQAEYPEPLS